MKITIITMPGGKARLMVKGGAPREVLNVLNSVAATIQLDISKALARTKAPFIKKDEAASGLKVIVSQADEKRSLVISG